MRYYDIAISDPKSGSILKHYSSHPGGGFDPGALRVELDIPVTTFDTVIGSGNARVWGVSIQDIGQASDLNMKNIIVSAGMKQGLPLANPAQSGVIVQGIILQAFGNWQDTNMTLDLQIGSATGSPHAPVNAPFFCKKGQSVSAAIMQTLKTALPSTQVNINISPKLVFTEDYVGYYQSIHQFAQVLTKVTAPIIGGSYTGVRMLAKQNQISVYDGTSYSSPKQIAFNDLIGQITWQTAGSINFKTVMRADVQVGDVVMMPQGQVATQAQSYSQYRQNGIFTGVFQVDIVRHLGNSRAPSGNDWVTVFDAHGPIKQMTQ